MSIEIEIQALIASPDTSEWLKSALMTALPRDPVDAANDAETLLSVLDRRATEKVEAALASVTHSTQGLPMAAGMDDVGGKCRQ